MTYNYYYEDVGITMDCNLCEYADLDSDMPPCRDCMHCGNGSENNYEPIEKKDNVNSPEHYNKEGRVSYYWEYGVEVKEIIRYILEQTNPKPFEAFCIGTEIAYRLRAGLKDKDKMYEDLDKAMNVREWRNEI